MPALLISALEPIGAMVPLAQAADVGIELLAFSRGDTMDAPRKAMLVHAKALSRFKGRLYVHAPFVHLYPGSPDKLVRDAAQIRVQEAAVVALELGASDVVAHHGFVPGACSSGPWIEQSIAFWHRVLASVSALFRIHLENVVERTPAEMLAVIEGVADPRLSVCLDVAHARLFSPWSVLEWIDALGPYLTHVHLCDNFGHRDAHLALGQGDTRWPLILDALLERAPQASWTIEAPAAESLQWLSEHGYR